MNKHLKSGCKVISRKAIGVIRHRTNPECYSSFEVSTCREEYEFGSCYLVGVRADTRGTYSVMASSWRFDKYANLTNSDDDGMKKESEIVEELIEDERHDCDPQPEKTEWAAGEKPLCGVWLELLDPVDGRKYVVLKYKYISDCLAIFVEKDASDFEQAGEWQHFAHKLYVDPKEKALAQIAFALATNVIGEDAAGEINFNRDNDYSRDYRNMAQAIIDGCIGHVEYTGDK
ncbi:hypothetical protein BvCmsNSP001_00583 [Escherichia coli]|uniref:hypothetical protein n=1 Tax=Escherichia coli TaxID=562 RepID=UPI0010CF916F|nr:hypothetical protein [Escherichia coli]GDN92260.1 hypothetical protein BvCmsNSP001_00583 [Escherichia coli]